MKKILSLLPLLVFIFSINLDAGTGEGVSSVGILSSFNNTNTIIITHGFTGDNLMPIPQSLWKHYIWQFALASAVSNNKDIYLIRKAIVYKIIADTSIFKDYTLNHSTSPIENFINLYGQEQVTPVPNKDNVFIFDWTLESAVNNHGFAEAAGDVLASSLVKLGKDYPFILEHLHFIGHSRGCVVNSEAIQRLIYWASLPNGLNIDPNIHMTTLDPHPAGHWLGLLTPMNDDGVNSWSIFQGLVNGVVGWKGSSSKVSFIDNYFQIVPVSVFWGLADYPGLNNANGDANVNLTLQFGILNTGAHNLVHTWYHGTVSSIAQNDSFNVGIPNIDRSTQWYNSDLGTTEGFYRSFNRPGGLTQLSSIESELKDVTIDNNYGPDKLIFNGDFIKGDNVNVQFGTDPMPGWSYQDGNTTKRGGIFNPAALLNDDHNILVHNSLYIPSNVQKVHFTMRVLEPSDTDILKLYIGNNEIGAYTINNFMFTKSWFDAVIPTPLLGTVDQLKFELTKTDQLENSLLIDDVSFLANEEIRSTVACPVDFNIYDNLGNHTGPINDSTYIEEIPGSDYYVYEDSTGDKIKTVYLKPLEGNANYTFVIKSRDTTSSFTYEIEDYSDTTQGTVSYRFDNVAIQPNTVATCSLDVNTQIPELLVDIDGDGTIDSTYYPYVIIPVELISLKAELNEDQVIIKWKTSSELNNKGFEIERQNPKIIGNNWVNIGYVEGKGTTTEVNEYTFADNPNLVGKIIYRLKQIDFDGSFSYSDIVEIEISIPMVYQLDQNSPNPFNPTTIISYSIPEVSKVSLKVYDILGSEITTLINEDKSPGKYTIQFNSQNLSSGIYFYTLQTEKFSATKKMILLK